MNRRLVKALQHARSGRRVSLILAVYVLLTMGLTWRLATLQVVSAEEYRELGTRQTHRDLELPARRGKLYDRDGDPLAMSVTSASIYVQPRALASDGVDASEVSASLAAALEHPDVRVNQARILQTLRSDTPFAYVARQIPRDVGDRVAELRLPGVGVLDEPLRTYPAGQLAAPLVGFAGTDHVGLSGLELQYDEVLAGQPGMLQFERAPGGLEISAAPRDTIPSVPGTDLVLTLDRELQATTEGVLADAVVQHQAKGAAAVVLDVETGEILAMATAPNMDGPRRERHRAVTDAFEPGSVNKVITIAGAIEEGLIKPDEEILVPPSHKVGGKTFRDAHGDPTTPLPLRDIMARSSNVGTILIAEQLGPDRLHDYIEAFGYGQPSGLDFPGESSGMLLQAPDWTETSLPTIAIGHGVSATLLQVAGAFNVIANGGEWIAPTLLRGTVDADGRLEPADAPDRRTVVSNGTARGLTDLMAAVVSDEKGTGRLAAVPGYDVAGKTGTAQKPREDGPGYQPGAYVATFAGFAPADDPELVVAVMLDEPTGSHSGGKVSAPVFSQIMNVALTHQRVAPSQETDELRPATAPSPPPPPPPPLQGLPTPVVGGVPADPADADAPA